MSDNTRIDVGTTGDTIATEDVGGAKYQRVKLIDSTAGSTAPIGTTANPLKVSSAALPLPAGASTEATLAALKSAIDALSAKITACNTGSVTLDAATLTALESITAAVTGTVAVSNFPATQAVTGTFWPTTQPVSGAFYQTTQPVSLAAVPLPSGASTETTLAALNAKFPAIANGRVQVELPSGGSGLTNTELRASAIPVSGSFYQATQPVSGTFWQATQPVSGNFYQATQPVSLAAVPLPTGAATETTLAALNAKLPAVANGRVQVELPAGGGGLTDAELRLNPVPVTGSFSSTPDDTLSLLLQAILANMPRTDTAKRLVVNNAEISHAVTVTSGAITCSGTVAVSNAVLTDTQLRASPVPVNQSMIGGRDSTLTAAAMTNAGTMHIYNNIVVA